MHLRIRGVLGAAALLTLLVPLPALAAPVLAPDIPPEVSAWFAAEAADQVRAAPEVLDLPAAQLDDVSVGPPRVVRTWSEEYIAGASLDPVSVPLEEWIAPLVLRSADDPAPVGTVRAWRDPAAGGAVSLAVVDGDTELAAVLLARAAEVPFILDAPLGAWFSTVDGEVWPLTAAAEDVLLGSVPVETFQPLLAERYAAQGGGPDSAGGGAVPDGGDGPRPALVAVLAVLVAGAVATVVLVRQYRRADSRLDADVRGGGT